MLAWPHSKSLRKFQRIPKTQYVSLTQLEVGVHDAVANFNIGGKAPILIYEKMDMIIGRYTLNGCKNLNVKRLFNSILQKFGNFKIVSQSYTWKSETER